jgi:internalin A
VSDLLPLVGLSALQTLKVIGTLVSDLTPLASLSALQTLDVSYTSVSDLTPLAGLSALQTLDVSYTSVSDLTPLAGLSALQTHDVSGTSVSDLSPLAGLSALQTLHVTDCQNVGSWEPLREHEALHELIAFGSGSAMLTTDLVESLPALEQLIVHRLLGVPPEVLSENEDSNCLSEFRSWAADLRVGEDKDQEVKIFVLGNGTAGKTQICRQLRGEGYDDQVPSTHGVQIGHFPLLPDAGRRATKAKLWDFGGQDIYHGTHALFLEGRAVFILVWSREVEAVGDYEESGLSMHHHRLTYWLDYVRSLAGEDAALVVVQAKCDLESDRTNAPLPTEPRFKRPLPQVTCSAKLGEMDELNAAIRSATRYLLEVHGTYRLPASWAAVRDKLRELKLKEKTVSRERFDELCRETHGTSVPAALLSYLHRSGEVFYREGLFKDEIVLDQEWALRAIYAVLDRNGPCQVLRQMGGTFTLPILSSLAWRDEFSEQEQATILGMMASCAICFPLDERHHQSIQRYALPDLLPLEAEAKTRVEALWRPDLAAEKVTLEYSFLHAGILRQFLCEIGSLGGPDAAYWRYGCCFYDSTTHSRARIRAEKAATPEAPARGRIVIETCDGNARELLTRLQKAITEIRIGQPPQVMEEAGSSVTAAAEREDSKPLAETLKIVPAPLDPAAKPQVWLSYGWGASDDMVGRLEARLNRADYDVRRDVSSTKLGQRILDFEREIGRGARVIVIISTKYLESIHCMRELLLIHQHSQGDQTSFLSRVVPLILEDVNIRDDEQRLDYVGFWVKKHEALDQKMGGLPRSALGTTPETLAMMQQFYQCAQPILAWLADVLMPRGITDIEKDDFAAVIAALKAKG